MGFRASRHAETGPGEARGDLCGALDVARGDKEACRGALFTQDAQSIGEDFLFSLVGAAAEKDWVGGVEAEAREHGTEVPVLRTLAGGVVFHTAGQVQSLRWHAEMFPECGVRLFLKSDGLQMSGHGAEHRREAPVAARGTW